MTTMNNDLNVLTEEDVRSKIVLPWLFSQGFDKDQVLVERSFSIRLGHGVLTVENGTTRKKTPATKKKENETEKEKEKTRLTGRADVIVRNRQGRNLMVIEVKAPHIQLTDNDRKQAISYARLLEEGDIAPISVVTNGDDTKVYDTFTCKEIRENSSDLQKFCENPNAFAEKNYLDLRADALESLLSLSEDSLLSFCEGQIEHRMRPLYSDDLNSGKKFIPELYVARAHAQENLDRLLDIEKRPVVLLVGPPQVGKTNFVCHAVRERLKQGHPSLFYPAIGLDAGLFSSLLDDFQWMSAKDINGAQAFLKKLHNILRVSNKRLVIFIDGWNEANSTLARQIDSDSHRLLGGDIQIQIVITLTDIAAKRLLSGPGGNSSIIAEEASIPNEGAHLLEIAGESGNIPAHWSVVRVGRYSQDEYETAYDIYRNAYKVTVPPTHQKVSDPYMLGIAMKLYQGQNLPDSLDEPDLLRKSINEKILRAIDHEELNRWNGLTSLAQKMMIDGAPVSVLDTNKLWNVSPLAAIPKGFFEAALLSSVRNDFDQPAIDFYYGKERDYVIAYEVGCWPARLAKGLNLEEELTLATKTGAGYESLRWFFKQPTHMATLISLPDGIPRFDNAVIRRILISALYHLAPHFSQEHEAWLKLARSYIDFDPDSLVIIECVKLVAILAKDSDEVSSLLGTGSALEDRIRAMLSVAEDYPLSTSGVGGIVLDALRDLHDGEESYITLALRSLIDDPSEIVQESAAVCLGYVDWQIYFEIVSKEIRASVRDGRPFEKFHLLAGVDDATNQISEFYYGGMCRGMLESVCEDEDYRQEEHRKLSLLFTPVLAYLSSTDSSRHTLEELLETIRGEGDIAADAAGPLDPYTLPLPF